jgi:hypothetical protein
MSGATPPQPHMHVCWAAAFPQDSLNLTDTAKLVVGLCLTVTTRLAGQRWTLLNGDNRSFWTALDLA